MKKYLKYALVGILLVIFGITINNVCFYADDFYYKTFLDDGLTSFFQKNIEHYNTVNGRAVVHLIAEVLLNVPKIVFFAFVLLCFFVIFWYSYKLFSKNKLNIVYYILISFSLIFLIDTNILKESIFWITGASNYLFPFTMIMMAFYFIDKSIQEGKISIISLLLTAFTASLTEQAFILLIVLTSVDLFCKFIKEIKRFKYKNLIFLLVECIGFLPVLLSPAVGKRVSGSVSVFNISILTLLKEHYSDFCNHIINDSWHNTIYLASVLIIALLPFVDKKASKVFLIGIVSAVLLFVSNIVPNLEVISLTSFFIYLVIVGIINLKSEEFKYISLNAFSVVGISSAMFLLGEFNSYRTIFAMSMLSLIMLAITVTHYLSIIKSDKIEIFVKAFLLCGIISSVPISKGYINNRKIFDSINDEVKSYNVNKKILINTNVDKRYALGMGYENGQFIDYFYDYFDIKDEMKENIYYIKDEKSKIFINDELLRYPALFKNNKTYVPMREVVEALGGTCDWNIEYVKYTLNDYEVHISNFNKIIYSTNDNYKNIDLSNYYEKYMDKKYLDIDYIYYILGYDVLKDSSIKIGM